MTVVHDFKGQSCQGLALCCWLICIFLLVQKYIYSSTYYCDHSVFFVFVFFVQCIIKQLLGSVFVISRIIKVSVRVISLQLWLITLTSTLIILDIAKTSTNNCLLTEIGLQFKRKFSCLRSRHKTWLGLEPRLLVIWCLPQIFIEQRKK